MEDIKEITNLMKFSSEEDIDLISRAFGFAQKSHENQKRLSGKPYFNHAFETAKILADLGVGATTISAGLLHDCLEDGESDSKEITDNFGEEILFLVEGVTKLGKLKYRGIKRYNENLRKLFVAVSQDIRVIIIKLADRLHNMRTLNYVPEHKRLRIATETLEIYVPIAHRLGIRKICRELEDLAFPYVYPKEYKKTKEILSQRKKEDYHKLNKFQRSIKKALAKREMTQINVDYRIKTLYSLYHKLLRKDWNIDKIYDISALRIIVPEDADCYQTMGIIHEIWRPLPGRIKDYIAFPKPNGYKALHTTVFTGHGNAVEIQIKTRKMHQEAEYGVASHVSYKENQKKALFESFSWIKRLLPFKKTFNGYKEREEINFNDIPSWIKELVEYQKENPNTEKELKNDFFQLRIFAFTPKGDVIDLPIDSSPIDFAYAIHTDIGNHVSEAKINGKIVPLERKLKNGDIVEIFTKKTSRPSRKWLSHSKTTIARKHIKASLKK